ncbi:MAG: hypothetical protein CMG96_01455 [Marinovum sp.]|nr:hypothetical protein [Marinovum sp.]
MSVLSVKLHILREPMRSGGCLQGAKRRKMGHLFYVGIAAVSQWCQIHYPKTQFTLLGGPKCR